MNRSRQCAALGAARGPAAHCGTYSCEPLEQRTLLDGDPVIVLTEPFDLTTWPETVNETTVHPWLWKNPLEYEWDLSDGDWNTIDEDENGYPDDAYGWNFFANNPNILATSAPHGATIVDKVLRVLNASGSDGDRVRIMHVIGTGAQIAQYVVEQKALDANIVAVSNSTREGAKFSRADAELLRDHDILLFVGSDNGDVNTDPHWGGGTAASFYHATPRRGVQEEPVQTIIPVTTDPAVAVTHYGMNSFYFAASRQDLHIDQQSFAMPVAAAYAAVAAQAYQDEHNGDTPTALQIKQAMMSGLTYQSNLDNKTIGHDYVSGLRENGGILDLGSIIDAINDDDPGITGVSMTEVSADELGTTVTFELDSSATPTNWTISWGDNSFSDGSGVEVLPGAQDSRPHQFPFENVPHYYYPTIYAMSGTGNGRQVYLQSAQVEVVNTKWAPTSGLDNYTLSRSGGTPNLVVLTLQNATTTSASFAPGALPTALFQLGQGNDTITIDFTNGNPLDSMALGIQGDPGANNIVRVIGSAGAETFSVNDASVSVDGNQIVFVDANLYLNSGGGGDILNVAAQKPGTINTIHLDASQTFSEITVGNGGGIVLDEDGSFVLRTDTLSIAGNGFIDLADNDMIIDYTGPSPLATIQSLITSGYAGGAWVGNGIRSSTAANDPLDETAVGYAEASDVFTSFPATFAGQLVDDTAVLVRYTLYGDADLNRIVELPDFNRLAANYGTTDKVWSQGDFDFDTDVDLDDFNLLAGNWGQSLYGGGYNPGGNGTYGYTVEDLLEHLLGGGNGLEP